MLHKTQRGGASTRFIPALCQKQRGYHWRSFTPANSQTIRPLQWWIIAPAFSPPNKYPEDNEIFVEGLRLAGLK